MHVNSFTTQESLLIAEKRLRDLELAYPNSSELIRFRDVIIPDLKSKLEKEV